MFWINFLHLYQPANIEKERVIEATKMSYERIIRALEEHPEIKFTLNITGCLLARWDEEFHYDDLIGRINKLIKKGQIELVGSAAYHALLPLVSITEAKKQIEENEVIIKKYFGNIRLKGFFFPEMAIDEKTAKLVKKLGYEWIIVDEIALGKIGASKNDKGYIDKSSGLKVIFRNRDISESYVPESLLKSIKENTAGSAITASDAELYGLRHIDHLADFEKLLKHKDLSTSTISNFIKTIRSFEKIRLASCSWQTTEKELQQNKNFFLWNNGGIIHKKLWHLAVLAESLNLKNIKDENYFWSRWHLVRGLASCVFWWASGKDFRQVFGPVAWNPDEIERGINELVRSIRTLEGSTDLKTKLEAEKLALDIKKLIWKKHWSRYGKQNT